MYVLNKDLNQIILSKWTLTRNKFIHAAEPVSEPMSAL